jgi:low molecular weight phosphotyrosine protein phosphatase
MSGLELLALYRMRREKPMVKDKVLFICIHNSARSQMAEAFLKNMAANCFEVESTGLVDVIRKGTWGYYLS